MDSGSQYSNIPLSVLERAGESKNISTTNVKMTCAQGSIFEVKWRCKLELQLGKKDYMCDFSCDFSFVCGDCYNSWKLFLFTISHKIITYPHKEPLFILENNKILLVKANVGESTY